MKIKSEYAVFTECIDRGIERGYDRAFKHNDNADGYSIKQAIYEAITLEVSEYFSFDNEVTE